MIDDEKFLLSSILNLISQGRSFQAIQNLRFLAKPLENFCRQDQYSRIAKKIISAGINLPEIRVAFLGGSTLDQWVDCLRFWLLMEGFQLKSYIAPFNSWHQETLDFNSGIYEFKPQIIWLFLTWRDVCAEIFPDPSTNVDAVLSDVELICKNLINKSNAFVVVNNADFPRVRIMGNFESQCHHSRLKLLRHFNLALPEKLPDCTIFDLAYHSACYGLNSWEDSRLWQHSKHPFCMDAIGGIAFAAARLIAASRGMAKKCIVLDLDNTIWGGIVGDDGVDGILIGSDDGPSGKAFLDFQLYLKSLSQRGIALAVCSKNDERLAKAPFETRKEMALKFEDFAVFVANWNNKSENLRLIAAKLNLGLDSFLFVDDNPAERDLIRTVLPEVSVVELPNDPSEYIDAIDRGAWFETITFSKEDLIRSKSYKENASRSAAKSIASDLNTYLKDLEMIANWDEAGPEQYSRLTQLINKTNQFNLTGTRITKSELTKFTSLSDFWVGWFSLKDRFGMHGIISAVILRFKGNCCFIETWVMSCRVFSRGMEDFIFSKLVEIAKKKGCEWLTGLYVPSDRNFVVSDLFNRYKGECEHTGSIPQRWNFNLKFRQNIPEFFINEER